MAPIQIGEALKQFIEKSRLKKGLHEARLEEIWLQMMGASIAAYTNDITIIDGTLIISTNVGPLKNELLYQKELIIQRINEELKDEVVKKVIIQ
jgi:hypothetical protein